MVRPTQPSRAGDERAGSPARRYPAGLAWGDQLTGARSLSGTPRGSSLRCIGTFITNARYWIGPVSGDPPSSPVSSIRSTKPCSPRSEAFRWNHHGHFRFAYRACALLPQGWRGAWRPRIHNLSGAFFKPWPRSPGLFFKYWITDIGDGGRGLSSLKVIMRASRRLSREAAGRS